MQGSVPRGMPGMSLDGTFQGSYHIQGRNQLQDMPPKQQSEAGSTERPDVLEPAPGKFLNVAYLMPRQLAQVVRQGFSKSKRAFDAGMAAWFGFPPSPP